MKEFPTIFLDGSDVDVGWVELVAASLSDRSFKTTSPASPSQIVIPGGVKDDELYIRLTSAPWKQSEKIFAAKQYSGHQKTIVLFVPAEPFDQSGKTGWMRHNIYQAIFGAMSELNEASPDLTLKEGGNVTFVEVKSLLPSLTFEIQFHPDLSTEQIEKSFAALADYYRACGGTGLRVEFEEQDIPVPEAAYDGRW